MTPSAYLEQLRGALDTYEAAEQAARRALQERLRGLLGLELVNPIDPAATSARPAVEGAMGAGQQTAASLPSSAIQASPAGETARSRKGVRASTTPPATTRTRVKCPDCDRVFTSGAAMGGHRGRVHNPRRRAATEQPKESEPVTPSKGDATADGSDAGQSPTPPAAIEAPAPARPASPPGRAVSESATDSPGQGPRDQRSDTRSPSVGSPAPAFNPRSKPPLEGPPRAEVFVGE